jgi:hypothetical protein
METTEGVVTSIVLGSDAKNVTVTLDRSPPLFTMSLDDPLFPAMVSLFASAKASGKPVILSYDSSNFIIRNLEIRDN